MPKIVLNYQGNTYAIPITVEQVGRKQVQQIVLQKWGLQFQNYCLTYLDMDGDQITTDIQQDFQVAKMTMADSEDNLTFILVPHVGFAPTFKKQQSKQASAHQVNDTAIHSVMSSGVREIDVHDDAEEQIKAHANQNIQKVEENIVKEAVDLQHERLIQQQQAKVRQEQLRKLQEELRIEEEKRLRQQEEMIRKQMELQQMELRRREQQQAKLAKESMEKKKKEDQKLAKEQMQKKRKEEKQRLKAQQKQRQKKQKAEQKAQKQKISQQKKKLKQAKEKEKLKSNQKKDKEKPKLQVPLTQARVKQLIRLQIQTMLPELKTKILGKQQQKIISIKIEEQQKQINKNNCHICNGVLKVPFYYSTQQRINICSNCQAKDDIQTPLMKIKNYNHFEEVAFMYGGSVLKNQLTDIQVDTQKYIQAAKLISITKIKEDFKQKTLQLRKFKAEQQKRLKEKQKLQKKAKQVKPKKQVSQ